MPIIFTYQAPNTYLPPLNTAGGQPIFSATIGNQHINDASFVVLGTAAPNVGAIIPAAVGANSNIVGIIQHDSSAVWDQQDPGLQGVFGFSLVNTGLFPAAPGQALVGTLGPPVLAEANLSANTGWISGGGNQATFGTPVGLNLDPTTGFYYFDPTQSRIGVVSGVLTGDGNMILGVPYQPTPIGLTGTLGARVVVAFDPQVLAIPQGQ
jgi:hypothetical protein